MFIDGVDGDSTLLLSQFFSRNSAGGAISNFCSAAVCESWDQWNPK